MPEKNAGPSPERESSSRDDEIERSIEADEYEPPEKMPKPKPTEQFLQYLDERGLYWNVYLDGPGRKRMYYQDFDSGAINPSLGHLITLGSPFSYLKALFSQNVVGTGRKQLVDPELLETDNRQLVVFVAGHVTTVGGIGCYFGPDSVLNLSRPLTDVEKPTIQNTHIKAAIEALKMVKTSTVGTSIWRVVIVTDSDYLVDAMTMHIFVWKADDWKKQTKGKKPVANREELEMLDNMIYEAAEAGYEVLFLLSYKHENAIARDFARKACNSLEAAETDNVPVEVSQNSAKKAKDKARSKAKKAAKKKAMNLGKEPYLPTNPAIIEVHPESVVSARIDDKILDDGTTHDADVTIPTDGTAKNAEVFNPIDRTQDAEATIPTVVMAQNAEAINSTDGKQNEGASIRKDATAKNAEVTNPTAGTQNAEAAISTDFIAQNAEATNPTGDTAQNMNTTTILTDVTEQNAEATIPTDGVSQKAIIAEDDGSTAIDVDYSQQIEADMNTSTNVAKHGVGVSEDEKLEDDKPDTQNADSATVPMALEDTAVRNASVDESTDVLNVANTPGPDNVTENEYTFIIKDPKTSEEKLHRTYLRRRISVSPSPSDSGLIEGHTYSSRRWSMPCEYSIDWKEELPTYNKNRRGRSDKNTDDGVWEYFPGMDNRNLPEKQWNTVVSKRERRRGAGLRSVTDNQHDGGEQSDDRKRRVHGSQKSEESQRYDRHQDTIGNQRNVENQKNVGSQHSTKQSRNNKHQSNTGSQRSVGIQKQAEPQHGGNQQRTTDRKSDNEWKTVGPGRGRRRG